VIRAHRVFLSESIDLVMRRARIEEDPLRSDPAPMRGD